jgi:integrase
MSKNKELYKGLYYYCECGVRCKAIESKCSKCGDVRPEYACLSKLITKNKKRVWENTEKPVALSLANINYDENYYISLYEANQYFSKLVSGMKMNRINPDAVLAKKLQDKSKTTVNDIYDEYINERESRNIDMSNHKFLLENFKKVFGDEYVKTITRDDIELFLSNQIKARSALSRRKCGKPIKNSTKNKYKIWLSTFFTYCIDREITDKNPTDKIQYGSKRGDKNKTDQDDYMPLFLYPDEFVEFWEEYCLRSKGGSRFALYVLISTFTGARSHEIQKLTPAQFDFDAKTLELQGKNGSPTYVSVPVSLIDFAQYHISKHEIGFRERIMLNKGAKRGDARSAMEGAVERFAEKYPKYQNLTFHHLRHTFATWLYALTNDPFYVEAKLRHKSVNTTAIYVHIEDGHKERILKYGNPFELLKWPSTEVVDPT